MKYIKLKLFTVLAIFFTQGILFSEPVQESQDLITLSGSTPFPKAVSILSTYFRTYDDITLVDLTNYTGNIGVDFQKIHWKSAFNSIILNLGLDQKRQADNIIISRGEKATEIMEKIKDDVLIEVTFFEADFNTVRELGIDWSTFVDGEIQLRADLRSPAVSEEILSVNYSDRFESGSTRIDINTLFRTFSATDKGHIISRPQITITSGEEGRVQDGLDYTILIPGRTVLGEEIAQAHEVNVQSGTIVTVSPEVFYDDKGEKYIALDINVERSSAFPSITGYTKRTSELNSKKTLYSGEETIIGGLTSKETINVRKGIPIIKDLPWWFFGLRYLAGYSKTELATKELIILIKATIIPQVEMRKLDRIDLKEEIDRSREQIPRLEPKLLN